MLPLHFHGGVGKKGRCFLSVVSVFSVTHSSLQKTNSPNESGCAVAAPGVSYSAPARSSTEPFAGSAPKIAGHVPRPLCSQRVLLAGGQYVGALCEPRHDSLQPSRGHCTHCCVYTTSTGGKVTPYDFTPRAAAHQGLR